MSRWGWDIWPKTNISSKITVWKLNPTPWCISDSSMIQRYLRCSWIRFRNHIKSLFLAEITLNSNRVSVYGWLESSASGLLHLTFYLVLFDVFFVKFNHAQMTNVSTLIFSYLRYKNMHEQRRVFWLGGGAWVGGVKRFWEKHKSKENDTREASSVFGTSPTPLTRQVTTDTTYKLILPINFRTEEAFWVVLKVQLPLLKLLHIV